MRSTSALEARFDADMEDTYIELKEKYFYPAERFHQMLKKYGGGQTARQLLQAVTLSEGFKTLKALDRLDLSVEAFVIKDEYAPLFTAEEREIAASRLAAYGYKPR